MPQQLTLNTPMALSNIKFEGVKPNSKIAKLISNSHCKRLKISLLHLFAIWEQNFSYKARKCLLSNIDNINECASDYWFKVALNSKISDITLNHSELVPTNYFHSLENISSSVLNNELVISYSDLLGSKKDLFDEYSVIAHPETNQFYPVDIHIFNNTKELILDAVNIISETLDEFHTEFKCYINNIIVFSSNSMSAGTSANLAKCIYIQTFPEKNMRSLIKVTDRLIHETAHMHLHLLSFDDEFVKNDFNEKFGSPFRLDLRPMIGIFHAHFVMFRLLLALTNSNLRKFFKTETAEIDDMIERYKIAFKSTEDTISKFADFTELGELIFKGTQAEFRNL